MRRSIIDSNPGYIKHRVSPSGHIYARSKEGKDIPELVRTTNTGSMRCRSTRHSNLHSNPYNTARSSTHRSMDLA